MKRATRLDTVTAAGVLAIIAFLGLQLWRVGEAQLMPAAVDRSRGTDLGGVLLGTWYPLVECVSNAYYLWRDNPILSRLGVSASAIWWTHLAVIALSLCSLAIVLAARPSAMTMLVSVLTSACFAFALAIWGGHSSIVPAVLSSMLALTAVLILTCRGTLRSLSFFWVLLAVGWGFLSANQLAAALIALAIPLSRFFLNKDAALSLEIKGILLIGFVLSLVTAGITPLAPLPDYPPGARVVPDDGLAGDIHPLIGSSYPLPVINRGALKSALLPQAKWSALLIAAVWLYAVIISKDARWKFWLLVFGLFLVGIIDCGFTEEFAHIAPLAALSRLMPGLFLFALSPLVIVMALTLAVSAISSQSLRFALSLLSIIYIYRSSGAQAPLAGLSNSSPRQYVSPSLAVYRDYSFLLSANLFLPNTQQSMRLSAEQVTLTASSSRSEKALGFILDKREKNRWSPKESGQHGGEWLHIFLNSPMPLTGIIISPGAFVTDFPRGLRISVSAGCKASFDGMSKSNYTILRDFPSWQGAVRFTEDGYPYYGGQDEVEVMFPYAVMASCVLIEQTGATPVFDWSVAEVALLSTRSSP